MTAVKSLAKLLALVLPGAAALAGPTDDAIVAAMKIVDAPNYTWTCSAPVTGRALVIREGKSQKNGYTVVTFVDPQSSMLRQVSRMNEGVVTAVFRGSDNFVFQTTDGWKDGHELVTLGARRRSNQREPDYWISMQSPGEELEIIIGSYTELHAVKAGVAGTLSDDGARQLLGSVKAPAVSATGSFVLAISGGVLTGYILELSGTLMMGPPGEEKESAPRRVVLITELKNVGRTVVEVPDEVKGKLER
jgi:hypothetical protein